MDGTLGQGGMAVVYLAYDTELHRPVAVKVLAEHGVDDASFQARFVREARSAARLSHPNIVQVFDIGEAAGRPFIVMEYVEGETLADILRRERRLAPERVSEIARQCCSGLACAHAAGLVHRDVKPQNLLVTPEATIKIADFGIAHALDQTRLTLTGSIVGTARYLAPEQAEGRGVTTAADVYALGVVTYELLTGRPPHPGDSLPELIAAKRTEPVTPPRALRREIPAELDAAVMACLEPAPADRPTAEALAQRLAAGPTAVLAAGASPPPTTVPAGPARRTFRPRRRRPGRVAAAVAVLAVAAVLALLAASLAGGSSPRPQPVRTPSGPTAEAHAHNLAHWLRGHTG